MLFYLTDAPVFETPPSDQKYADVGQTFTLVVKAKGNPSDINYTWSKDSVENVTFTEGPVLNFTHIAVEDSGWYTCTAVNSVGSADWTFNLSVIGERIKIDFETYQFLHSGYYNLTR